MASEDRVWLLGHLDDQARALAQMTTVARQHPNDPGKLTEVRDQIFVTLDTLGVPHATATHDDWHRAIGTESP
jgi:hypothetical protein